MTGLGLQIGAGAAVGAGLIGLGAYAIFNPRSRVFFPVVCRGDRSAPARVALTFDDGPGPGSGPVLDVLGDAGVQGTFFIIGANAAKYPDLVRRMDAEGHIVANHTFDHRRLGALKCSAYWRDQLRRTDEIIEEIIGKKPALFRPPLGFKSWWMAAPLRQSRHTTVAWTRRALDGVVTTTDRILERLVGPASAGDILALHDGEEPDRPRDPSPTVAAILPLIAGIRKRGIRFERLDRLIGVEPYSPAPTEALGRTEVSTLG